MGLVVIALAGAATAVSVTGGEHVACGTASTAIPDRVLGVDGVPVTTLPGASVAAEVCVTATDQTVTEATTVDHTTTVTVSGTTTTDPVTTTTAPTTSTTSPTTTATPPSGAIIMPENQPWLCNKPVNVPLVKVTMRTVSAPAVRFMSGCTGHISRLEIDQYINDGMKIAAGSHDLTIDGGYIRCYGHPVGAHQDGIQGGGGQRITFTDFDDSCASANNAAAFINAGGNEMPTDIVWIHSRFTNTNSTNTFFISSSLRTGARDSLICGHFRKGGTDVVDVNNTIVAATDPRCTEPW